jgi:signal transduction histidine kinase
MRNWCRFPYLLFLLAGCLPVIHSNGQATDSVIHVNEISSIRFIRMVDMGFIEAGTDVEKNYSSIHFQKGLANGVIEPGKISKKIILRFRIVNSTDSSELAYFFPGFFFNDTRLYLVEENSVIPLPSIAPEIKDNASIRQVIFPPRDTITLLAEIFQVKTYNNRVAPRLIHPLYLEAHVSQLHNSNRIEAFITYIFCGLLIMMVLFSLASYFQGGNREFLYYAGYALFLGFMLFTKPYYNLRSFHRTFFYEAYLDFILQCLGICFYMAFMMRFLITKEKHPSLHKLYKYGIIFLIGAMAVFTWLHYGTNNFFLENVVENYVTKGVLIGMIVFFLAYALRHWKDVLLRYLFWGNLWYFIFSSISLILILMPNVRRSLPGVFKSALLYYEIGLFLELVFFLAGLTYKNRKEIIEQTKEKERLTMENERKEMEKQMAVMAAHQDERNRISADMHDELGSGMTTIRLMSEIAKNKMKEQVPIEIEKISHSANDLLNKMNAIIWSMNSGNDTVDNLVSYIRAYALEYLEGTPIQCKITTPDFIDEKVLSGDKRRNIFLCVKETLNNSLKHSKASEMKIDITANSVLRIRIADNGVGIDVDNIRQFGNGLKNITRRMVSIGGKFRIEKDGGTVTTIELPLA